MSQEENITDGRYPISSLSHNKCKSFIKNLHPKNNESELVLFSDGWIKEGKESEFLKPESRRILNVKEVKSVEYSGGKYRNRFVYKLLSIISLLSAFVMLLFTFEIFEAVFMDSSLGKGSWAIYGAMIWVFFDLFRETMASPAHITFNLTSGENKKFLGDLPDGNLHRTSIIFVLIGVFFFLVFFLNWVYERSPFWGDIFGTVVMFLILWLLMKFLYDIFSDDTSLSGINSADIPEGLTHMYFAIMAIRSNTKDNPSNATNDVPISELEAIKARLLEHELLLSTIASFDDILSVPSPSLGAIAIRVSTETIMKNACESIGVKSKLNAKKTLISYVHQYKTKAKLDSKIESYLENIRMMGNRAAHDFNVDWDEFKIILNQFCEVVNWYSTILPKEFGIAKLN
ncbi:MAG: DUF4145 domain-containing protein [archaeon]|nr:DUF4145 domain-containing protein [archaeon]